MNDEFKNIIRPTNIETYDKETGIKTKTPYFSDFESVVASPLDKLNSTPIPVSFLGLTVSIKKRVEPIRNGELLYDKSGQPVAIKSNGKILPIIEGDL